jgi:hypothetical protein
MNAALASATVRSAGVNVVPPSELSTYVSMAVPWGPTTTTPVTSTVLVSLVAAGNVSSVGSRLVAEEWPVVTGGAKETEAPLTCNAGTHACELRSGNGARHIQVVNKQTSRKTNKQSIKSKQTKNKGVLPRRSVRGVVVETVCEITTIHGPTHTLHAQWSHRHSWSHSHWLFTQREPLTCHTLIGRWVVTHPLLTAAHCTIARPIMSGRHASWR